MLYLTILTCLLAGLATASPAKTTTTTTTTTKTSTTTQKTTTSTTSSSSTTVPSSCNATPVPTPSAGVSCGYSGTLKTPAYLGGAFSSSNRDSCAAQCAIIAKCNAFAYNEDQYTCQLYSSTLKTMGFTAAKKYNGVAYYGLGCFACSPSATTTSTTSSSTSSTSSSSTSSTSSSTSTTSSSSTSTSSSSSTSPTSSSSSSTSPSSSSTSTTTTSTMDSSTSTTSTTDSSTSTTSTTDSSTSTTTTSTTDSSTTTTTSATDSSTTTTTSATDSSTTTTTSTTDSTTSTSSTVSTSSTPTTTSMSTSTTSTTTTSSSSSNTVSCATASVTIVSGRYTDIYKSYFSGPGVTENTTNPGNTNPTYPPITYQLADTDACSAIYDCANKTDKAGPKFYRSFDLHYVNDSMRWECVTFYGNSSNANYFNVVNASISEAYGFSV